MQDKYIAKAVNMISEVVLVRRVLRRRENAGVVIGDAQIVRDGSMAA